MAFLTQFFNKFLQEFFEPAVDEYVKFGFNDGLTLNNLVIKPDIINDKLKERDVDIVVDYGRVGSMRLVWTALPGIVTLQIRDLDIRLRPNFSAIATKEISRKFEEINKADQCQSYQNYNTYLPPPSSSFIPHIDNKSIHDNASYRAPHGFIPPPPRLVRQAQYLNRRPPFSAPPQPMYSHRPISYIHPPPPQVSNYFQ